PRCRRLSGTDPGYPARRAIPSTHAFAFPRRIAPGLCINLPPKEGVGNAGCPVHPQPRVRMVVVDAHEYSQRVHRNRPAFPHAMVLTVSSALSPVIGLLTPSLAK